MPFKKTPQNEHTFIYTGEKGCTTDDEKVLVEVWIFITNISI